MTTLCGVCTEPLEEERLRTGPLKRICLDCLSDEERRALEHDLNSASQVQAHLLPGRVLRVRDGTIGAPVLW